MLKFDTIRCFFTAVMQNYVKSHSDRDYLIVLRNVTTGHAYTLVLNHSISSVTFVRDSQSQKSQHV